MALQLCSFLFGSALQATSCAELQRAAAAAVDEAKVPGIKDCFVGGFPKENVSDLCGENKSKLHVEPYVSSRLMEVDFLI